MKKKLCFLYAFIFGLFSLFNFKLNSKSFISASAYNETYQYEAELLSDYNSMGNYSIDSVESFSFNQELVFKITISNNTSNTYNLLSFKNPSPYAAGDHDQYQAFSFYKANNVDDYLNFGVVSLNNTFIRHSNSGYETFLAITPNSVLALYFSYGHITFNNDLSVNIVPRLNVANNFTQFSSYSYLVDMDSDTNFSLLYDEFVLSQTTDDLFRELVSLAFGGTYSQSQLFVNSSSGSVTAYYSNGSSFSFRSNTTFFYVDLGFIISNVVSDTIVNNNNGVNLFGSFGTVNIKVYRPVQRVNNTLVIYIYDYPQLISDVYDTSYSLLRGDDLYKINYSGSLPNSYFVYVFNQDIQNTLFDEYIDVSFYFSDALLTLNYDSDTGDYYTSFGFDFNFTYYSKPLVSSNSVYSYNFTKPSYVSMEFSLSPLYIPVLEAVENVFIFLLFYCPIISDIFQLLHLSEFIGSLLTVINYYTTGVLGAFITALISFLIFYLFFKSVMPSVSSGVSSVVDNSQFVYNREEYKKFLGKDKLSKRKNNYKKYETKRLDKGVNKLIVKSDKALKRSQKYIDKRSKYWKKKGKDL